MGNKVYTAVVLLLWSGAMSWLFCAKILPPFLRGDPPNSTPNDHEPVCWRVTVGDKPIGWAVSQAVPGADGTTELHSRVQLAAVPLARMAPRWMATLIDNVGPLELDMRSFTTLDSLGNLSRFESSVQVNELPSAILMRGVVDAGVIRLTLQYGEIVHKISYPWPEHATLGSKLTPDAKLLQVYVGRKWQEEVYNPFGGPQGAIEPIEAEVVDEQPLLIGTDLVNTRRIEFRAVDNTGVSSNHRRRSTLWVDEEGNVLREEIVLMDVLLRFDRQSGPRSEQLAAELLELDQFATLTTPNRYGRTAQPADPSK